MLSLLVTLVVKSFSFSQSAVFKLTYKFWAKQTRMEAEEPNEPEKVELTKAQRERIQRNKEKALQLKRSKLTTHPYAPKPDVVTLEKSTIKIGTTRYKDTGGGFLLEVNADEPAVEVVPIEDPAPILEPYRPTCETCNKPFAKSWLFDTFDCKVCDECKDPEVHKVITKTEAQNEYLLKDCDLDKREPPLKFVRRKNPHNSNWGDMKLYLQIQVEQRALEVWGSEEKLQEELEKREEKRVVMKTKKYQKQMNELRMSMRSSLYDRTTSASHVHEFGVEKYNEDDDTYTHSCTTCPYVETYEKM